QHRRQRAARRRRLNLILSVLGALAVIAVVVVVAVATGNDHTEKAAKSSSPSPSPSTSATASTASSKPVAAYPCSWKKVGTAARKVSVPPTTRPARTGTVAVAVRTSQGPMTFTLNRAKAPCAVESFLSLAQQKYFDKTACHRLTASATLHVLQCGDPTGTGSGGPGYQFADELTGREKYTRGVLAMANGGANTNGSQFFIVYGATSLQPAYTIFGNVTKGLAVVDKVAAKGSTPATDGKPKLPISITTVTAAK
ncbi:MAG TPA: peptidylprolyl isomerase, partial [Jatrophihabitans sp.]|nr:peptidylprolyl isomerase [Jatrophihabitans sp.]